MNRAPAGTRSTASRKLRSSSKALIAEATSVIASRNGHVRSSRQVHFSFVPLAAHATGASGPSSNRITSPTVMSVAGRASR